MVSQEHMKDCGKPCWKDPAGTRHLPNISLFTSRHNDVHWLPSWNPKGSGNHIGEVHEWSLHVPHVIGARLTLVETQGGQAGNSIGQLTGAMSGI